jgi:hypothetical protein
MSDVNLKRKVTLKRKGDSLDRVPEGKKPNKFIWLALLGMVIIGGVFGLKQSNKSNDIAAAVEEVVVSGGSDVTTGTPENEVVSKGDDVNNPPTKNNSPEQSDVSIDNELLTNSANSVGSNVTSKPKSTTDPNDKPKSTGNPIQSSSVSFEGPIEEKAKQVIRGDFGNGKDRKQLLGAEYTVIQTRVNEIYQGGLTE